MLTYRESTPLAASNFFGDPVKKAKRKARRRQRKVKNISCLGKKYCK
jgi:hypothetical protein